MEKPKTAKEKLDDILGINNVTELLVDLETTPMSPLISGAIQESVAKLNTQTDIYKTDSSSFSLHTFESSLNELTGLIDISKEVIGHLYKCVASSNLVDPEVIEAMAKIIEAARATTADYIAVYRDKLAFYNTVTLEQMKHANRKELLIMKIELTGDADKDKNALDLVPYTQEVVVKSIKDVDKANSKAKKPIR